jgi:PPM family protein phosphatase
MPAIRLSIAARTDVGRVRKSNEDAFVATDLDTGTRIDDQTPAAEMVVRERGVLLVVSDGMGGHAAGEVASAMVVDSLPRAMRTLNSSEPVELPFERAVQQANAKVFEAARDSAKEGMGATLTAVLIHERSAYVAEVGDSRAYVLRQGRLRQLTRDQSYVQLLLDAGTITPEQATSFANKNWIVQAMGLEPDVQASLGRLELRNDDRLLICCDGLYGLVNDGELAELLAEDDVSTACNRMVELANERGGTDNITVIVARIAGDELPELNGDESVTQTFKVLKDYCGRGAQSRTKPTLTSPPPGLEPPPKSSPLQGEPIPAAPSVPEFFDAQGDAAELLTPSPPVEPDPTERTASSASGRLSIVVMGLVLLFTAAGYWFVLAK